MTRFDQLRFSPRIDSMELKETDQVKSENKSKKSQSCLSETSVDKIKIYVDEHINGNLSLHILSSVAKLSPYHFSRCFKESVGVSPHKYIIQCRIAKAKKLLCWSKLPITKIALLCGYANISNFSNVFKKMWALHPVNFENCIMTRSHFGI